jgi:hypothetical protein
MARYEHLPIYRDAYDLTVHIEQIVRNFSRYHKYTLGTDLRNKMRAALESIVEANNAHDRSERLLALRQQLENLKVLCRLCHDSGAFGGGTKSYLHVAERLTGLARQNEGWLKSTMKAERGTMKAAEGNEAKGVKA